MRLSSALRDRRENRNEQVAGDRTNARRFDRFGDENRNVRRRPRDRIKPATGSGFG